MSDGEWPTLTKAAVRELARSKSYQRGQSYYEDSAVTDVVRRGYTVRAEVEGSRNQQYAITIEFDDAGVARTGCSCPYDHGGICKHRVAVLLTCIREPESVRTRPPLSEQIADADRETLEEILLEIAHDRPDLGDRIETRLETSAVADEAGTGASVSVNPERIRSQAEHALPKPGQRGHNDAYAEAQRMAGELDELLEQARLALEAGDGETALDVLEAITEVLVDNRWTGLLPHDVPDLFETIEELGEMFVEAVLTADLSEEERTDWEQQLREWDEDTTFAHFIGGTVLGAAADAVIEGWDDDRVQQALEGNLDHGEFGEDSRWWHAPDVIDVRLRILARQDRHEAYLEDVDEDIVEYGDEDDPAILCTDQYSIYDGIDEYDEIDGHLAINHDEHYVVGDAHTNSCENRHSFLRNWLRRFRGVSKHHLQGYLNFFSLTLNTDQWFEKILSTDFYR